MVTAILGLSSVMVLHAWRFLSTAIFGLRDRATSLSEIRVAVEFLRQDLGGARSLLPLEGDTLQIFREEAVSVLDGAWDDGADSGIVYQLLGRTLFRRDPARALDFAVASGVTAFHVERLEGKGSRIELAIGSGQARRSLTLLWLE